MTSYETAFGASSDAGAIITATRMTTDPRQIYPGCIYLVVDADGEQRVIDTDAYEDGPRRTVRAVTVHDVPSLLSYLHDFDEGTTEVWADQPGSRIVARLDAPAANQPAWDAHTVSLPLVHTPEWAAWTAQSAKYMSQGDFAELIEDRAADIVSPPAADMLELAQSFQAASKVTFESSQILASGQRSLQYREDIDAKAGRTGRLTIPATFDIALKPYPASEAYKVTARLRYRIEGGRLLLGYKLVTPERVLEDAFNGIVAAIEAEGLAVRRGTL